MNTIKLILITQHTAQVTSSELFFNHFLEHALYSVDSNSAENNIDNSLLHLLRHKKQGI